MDFLDALARRSQLLVEGDGIVRPDDREDQVLCVLMGAGDEDVAGRDPRAEDEAVEITGIAEVIEVVAPVTEGEVVVVAAGLAAQQVVAAPARDHVVSGPGEDRLAPGKADDRVGPGARRLAEVLGGEVGPRPGAAVGKADLLDPRLGPPVLTFQRDALAANADLQRHVLGRRQIAGHRDVGRRDPGPQQQPVEIAPAAPVINRIAAVAESKL